MISFVKGTLIMKTDRFIILSVNDIGYRIFVNTQTLKKMPKNGEMVSLWTHLYNREDTQELYGFPEYAELDFFEMLIQIPGIGPKSALAVLAVAPLDTLKKAISSGETSYLTKVSGIGRKTAEKIVLELREKLGALETKTSIFKEDQDVLEALQSLGYTSGEAREALKQIPEDIEGASNRIKEALKILSKK